MEKHWIVFWSLLAARCISAWFNLVGDCDETFNYWEPTHKVIYGYGMQTWEYSPTYALRSYFYIWIHAAPGWLIDMLSKPFLSLAIRKMTVFYSIRVFLAIFTTYAESQLIHGLSLAFTPLIADWFWFLSLFSSALFVSSTAYLPSSFAMVCFYLVLAHICHRNHGGALFWAAASVLVGWPFVGLLCIPIGLYLVLRERLDRLILYGVLSMTVLMAGMMWTDYVYYGQWLFAPWNIVQYNVLNPESGGSELYGVEPWYFYLLNLTLNVNVVLPLAVGCFVLLPFVRLTDIYTSSSSRLHAALLLLPAALWIGFMSRIPHKEERFLFCVYPFLLLCASVTLSWIQKRWSIVCRLLAWTYALVSISRMAALVLHYQASLEVWKTLSVHHLAQHPSAKVCVGKEWHRFPSHFFLPHQQLSYVRSSFDGQLPVLFASEEEGGTRVIRTHLFNDGNKEQMDRYVPVDTCDVLVDWTFDHQTEPAYAQSSDWNTLCTEWFLDPQKAPQPHRSLFLGKRDPSWYAPYVALVHV